MAEEIPEQASIVSIIREMVRAGESEEKIISSLKELGIEEKDAKRLLLLGEADTFALLESEINKMVKSYFDKEKPGLVKYIRESISKEEENMVQRVETRALSAFKEDQKFIENQATMFQARVNQSVKNILQLNQQTKAGIAELASRVSNNERDLWSVKDKVLGSKAIKTVGTILIALELGLIAATSWLAYSNAQNASFDTTVTAAAIGAILATMVFLIKMKT